ncbi:hypothetical protein ACWV26_08260 [Rummeliibacillus sp. JY-2-4R]
MKLMKFFVLLSVLLVSTLLPTNTFAATKEMYYPVAGTAKNSPGIYKAVPNGKSSAVLKEKVYTLVDAKKPPIKLNDVNFFLVNGKLADTSQYDPYSANVKPIRDVQAVGKDVYFTKFVFDSIYAGSCGGGGATILEIYKRASNGKVSKVVTDKVSSDAKNAFVITGNSMYYAKIVNEAMGNFTIVKSSLSGKSKQTLQKGVDDFWVNKKSIYFVKSGKLYRMDLNGKSLKSITSKEKLYGNTGCGEGNYSVSNNGMIIRSYSDNSNYFLDFTKLTITKLAKTVQGNVLDVDLQRKRLIAITYGDNEASVYALYDFNGKRIKTLKSFNWDKGPQFYSVDVKTGQLLYIEDSRLKQIKF